MTTYLPKPSAPTSATEAEAGIVSALQGGLLRLALSSSIEDAS